MSRTLHYNFAADKSLVARVGPTLSITRATDATYFDSLGVMQTAVSGVARFDHNPVTLESLGVYVEEARTNLCLHSEDIATAPWSGANEAVNVNQATAPDGALTMDQLIDDNSSGQGNVQRQQSIVVATDTSYIFSAFLQEDQLSNVLLQILGQPTSIYQNFDLSAGALGTSEAGTDDSGIEDVGNGIYRCWIKFTSDSVDTTLNLTLSIKDGDNVSPVDLDGTSSIFVWGVDFQAGGFKTSYIKTVAASVTRNYDNVFTADMASVYNIPEGTFYMAGRQADVSAMGSKNMMTPSSGSNLNRFFHNAVASQSQVVVVSDNVSVASLTSLRTASDNVITRDAYSYKVNDFEHYSDGVRSGTGDQLGAVPLSITHLFIGGDQSGAGNNIWNGHIDEVAYEDESRPINVLEDYSLNGVPSGRSNFITMYRRMLDRPPTKAVYPKPKPSLRDLQ